MYITYLVECSDCALVDIDVGSKLFDNMSARMYTRKFDDSRIRWHFNQQSWGTYILHSLCFVDPNR